MVFGKVTFFLIQYFICLNPSFMGLVTNLQTLKCTVLFHVHFHFGSVLFTGVEPQFTEAANRHPINTLYLLHFTDEEMEAQQG